MIKRWKQRTQLFQLEEQRRRYPTALLLPLSPPLSHSFSAFLIHAHDTRMTAAQWKQFNFFDRQQSFDPSDKTKSPAVFEVVHLFLFFINGVELSLHGRFMRAHFYFHGRDRNQTSRLWQVAVGRLLWQISFSLWNNHANEYVAYHSLTFCNTFDRFSLCVRPQLQDTFLPGIQGWPSDPFEAAQTKEHPDYSRSRCLCVRDWLSQENGCWPLFFHRRRKMAEHQ